MEFVSTLGVAVAVFASTNIDDMFLLSAFFADPHLRPRTVVLGQLLGIGTLVLGSVLASLAALTVPEGYTALLGSMPLFLGLRKLWSLSAARRESNDSMAAEQDDERRLQQEEHRREFGIHSQLLAVAVVTPTVATTWVCTFRSSPARRMPFQCTPPSSP